MSPRVISPSLGELNALPTPLTPGERRVLNLFIDELPDEWEIYIQPHLNGLRPDFVLLHPENGVAVYEVKDWDLHAMRYWFEGSPPVLRAHDGMRSFLVQDPVAQVMGYKDEIYNLYCPSFNTKGHFGLITAGAIFTVASNEAVAEVFRKEVLHRKGFGEREQNVIAGAEDVAQRNIGALLPLMERPHSLMSAEAAKELRPWLVQPEFAAEQLRPLELDRRRVPLVTTRTETGYRRIKGAAGSGKSLVLAARAAELAKEGKSVLVATYNITLLNYLRDLAVRWARGPFIQNITWLNYHAWAKRVCYQNGRNQEYADLFRLMGKDLALEEGVPELVARILSEDCGAVEQYDAILVDEGQDYRVSWWNNLRKSLSANGEMLLVADPTQDLYGTARAWTDEAMRGAGFRGPWTILEGSYRLPPDMIPYIREFAEEFLPADDYQTLPEPTQSEFSFEPVLLRWIQADPGRAIAVMEEEVLRLPSRATAGPLAWADVVFLASKDVGVAVVNRLQQRSFRVRHTFFDDERKERKSKMAFFKGDAGLKGTTIHSFKGWESRALVVHISDLDDPARRAAAYAAFTRVKRDPHGSYLTVVCDWLPAKEYGKRWPEFVECCGITGDENNDEFTELEVEEYDLQWRPLMQSLSRIEGVTILPGDEVMREGRVVDLDLATVTLGGASVRLVDEGKQTADKVKAALGEQGKRVLCIRPDQPDLVKDILKALVS